MSDSRTPADPNQAHHPKARRPAVEYDNRIDGRDVDDDVNAVTPDGAANLGLPVNDTISAEDAEDGTSQSSKQKQRAAERDKIEGESKRGHSQRPTSVRRSQGEAHDNDGLRAAKEKAWSDQLAEDEDDYGSFFSTPPLSAKVETHSVEEDAAERTEQETVLHLLRGIPEPSGSPEPDQVNGPDGDECWRRISTDMDRYPGYMERLEARRQNAQNLSLPGSATSLPKLDAALGGLQGISLLAGDTQTGKTSLACQWCLAALKHDPELAVLYFTLDDLSADDLFDQLICHEARVDHKKYVSSKMSQAESKAINEADKRLAQNIRSRWLTLDRIREDEIGLSYQRLSHLSEGLQADTNASRLLTVIDMFDNMPLPRVLPDTHEGYQKEIQRLAARQEHWRLEQIKKLSEESQTIEPGGWPILVLCKVRKPVSSRKELTVADILGPSELGYLAKRIFLLSPDPSSDPASTVVRMTLRVAKGRHGSSIQLPLLFHHTQFRFEEDTTGVPADVGRTPNKPGSSRSRAGRVTASQKIDPLAGL